MHNRDLKNIVHFYTLNNLRHGRGRWLEVTEFSTRGGSITDSYTNRVEWITSHHALSITRLELETRHQITERKMSDPQEYTVGWICALTTEYTAARVFLDREHDPPKPECIAASDDNAYTLGEIANHKIAIAVLPHGEYGTSSAATVATKMLNSFPNIRVGLMVGVGGGAPTAENDIRLGDIVVSSPRGGTGGVYQYDYGKRIQNSEFKSTGHLNQPPSAVLTAMSKLKSRYETDGHRIHESIEAILKSKPRLKKKYGCPGREHDVLYASNIVHPLDTPERDCRESCTTQSHDSINNHKRTVNGKGSAVPDHEQKRDDPSRASDTADPKEEDQAHQDTCEVRSHNIVYRQERSLVEDEDDPAIHYGTIASGNSLIKDAHLRDELAKKKGIMCFEMEAAGLMNQLPCLVVRGICDYSDSHKNKEWQGYAAMTASAYTMDLLKCIPPWSLEREQRLRDVLNSLHDEVTHVRTIAEEISHGQQSSKQQQLMRDIQKWLSPSDSSISQNKAFKLRHQGTGQWLLNSTFYLSWEERLERFIWLHGLFGCGKTVLASSIIHRLNSASPSRALAFFYFDVNGGGQQTVVQMLRTLLSQLCSRPSINLDRLQTLYNTCGKGTSSPSIDQLSDTLKDVISLSGQVTVVIDALDECDKPSEVISWLEDLLEANYSTLQLLVTSRSTGETGRVIDGWTRRHELHPIQVDGVNKDISDYLRARLFVSDEFSRWSSDKGLREMIEEKISQQANGMFRLAACQLEDLKRCKNQDRLIDALRILPKTLQEIYARTLTSLKASDYSTEALFMLQYLVWSEIPPTLEGMLDATAVRLHETPAFKKSNRIFEIMDLITLCSSLVTIIEVSRFTGRFPREEQRTREIHLAHSSVKEYLKSRHLARPFDQLSEEVHARGLIAQTCIGYLMSLPIDHFWHPNQNQFPFAATANHWMKHARVAEATDDTLVQLILKLYQMESARLGTAEGNNKLYDKTEGNGKLEYRDWNFGIYDYKYQPFATDPFQHQQDVLYEGPLTHASYWGLGTVVHRLLEAGTDVNADQCSDNPLHAAAFHGHDSVVKMLLANGANVNGTNDGQLSIPLIAASFNGHVKTAQILLQHGASIYARSTIGYGAFEMATLTHQSEFLRFLLRNRLFLELQSGILTNADEKLHLVNRGPARCVHRVEDQEEEASAGLAAVVQDLGPPCTHFCLHEALIRGLFSSDFACVEALIEYGADPRGCRHDCGSGRPKQPWLVAITRTLGPDTRRILELLREKGAELDAQATRSELLEGLYFRVELGELLDVRLLLELLGDMVLDPQELNELRQHAVDNHRVEAAEFFLERGADPRACIYPEDWASLVEPPSIPRSDGHHESRRGSWSDSVD
ncbi:hypothetical protein D6D10_06833 [Aureobasidium pullulans]|uniref:Nephrocystin 3-like N-terminal domain-containing protein n=1 Tax=Aureobasidium pullulans TaxID=5580 RepID=A0A4S9EPD6_AURPU|nr:hypothetical protein D6D10_06833 [Aureobasidium pullulans]